MVGRGGAGGCVCTGGVSAQQSRGTPSAPEWTVGREEGIHHGPGRSYLCRRAGPFAAFRSQEHSDEYLLFFFFFDAKTTAFILGMMKMFKILLLQTVGGTRLFQKSPQSWAQRDGRLAQRWHHRAAPPALGFAWVTGRRAGTPRVELGVRPISCCLREFAQNMRQP